jgi:hypothetical protein
MVGASLLGFSKFSNSHLHASRLTVYLGTVKKFQCSGGLKI